MEKSLDMSLDDIIKSKKSAGRTRARGGSRGSSRGERVRDTGRAAGRKRPLGVNAQPSSFTIAKSFRRTKNFTWQHDLLEESLAAAGIDSGMKLYISNLDRGVSNDDIRELFSEIGELKCYAIHFDKNGRPRGTAEVVYARRIDAFAAHKRYNNVQLDGRPMKIEIVNPPSEVPVSASVNVGGANGKLRRRVVLTRNADHTISSAPTSRGVGSKRKRGQRKGQGQTQSQGQQGQRWRRGWGRGKKQPVEKSAEELDKELDKYHAEVMQVS